MSEMRRHVAPIGLFASREEMLWHVQEIQHPDTQQDMQYRSCQTRGIEPPCTSEKKNHWQEALGHVEVVDNARPIIALTKKRGRKEGIRWQKTTRRPGRRRELLQMDGPLSANSVATSFFCGEACLCVRESPMGRVGQRCAMESGNPEQTFHS